MYVAMTRARRRLYLSLAQSRMLHGQTRYNIPSRFLDEIPEKFLKWLRPPAEDGFTFGRSNANKNKDSGARSAFEARKKDPFRRELPVVGQWRVGQAVAHAKFGEGVILDYEGSGSDARVQVNFGHAGTKWLMLEYARLTPV